jgi:hypothetical protein
MNNVKLTITTEDPELIQELKTFLWNKPYQKYKMISDYTNGPQNLNEIFYSQDE